ncbi:MAG: hypothetical protein AAF491_05275 [Verrucomicrobiota bacterium]
MAPHEWERLQSVRKNPTQPQTTRSQRQKWQRDDKDGILPKGSGEVPMQKGMGCSRIAATGTVKPGRLVEETPGKPGHPI